MTDPTERKTPPDEPDEWAFLWRGAERANDGWVVVGPLVAAIKNWKAWGIAVGLVVWLNRTDITAVLRTLLGEP